MRHYPFITFICFLFSTVLFSQQPTLDYYLPTDSYDPSIPTPELVFGHQIGEWHLSHDKLLMYYEKLAAASDKITLHEYGRLHEHRPLVYLLITSAENHRNIDAIREQHLALCDAALSGRMEVGEMPLVIYQGFSIHGNEPSGANGAPLVASRLGKGARVEVLMPTVA